MARRSRCLLWLFGVGTCRVSWARELLAASQTAYMALRVGGACYLIFLGTKMLLRKQPSDSATANALSPAVRTKSVNTSARRWFIRGLLTNLLNPKVASFMLHSFRNSFLPVSRSLRSVCCLRPFTQPKVSYGSPCLQLRRVRCRAGYIGNSCPKRSTGQPARCSWASDSGSGSITDVKSG